MSEATAEQQAPSKAEVRRAEESMSPLERAMTQAHYEIMSHEQDLLAEGVTKEQIESAAERAGKRVDVEWKEKEAQDPLVRIENALQEAVETEDDQYFADEGTRRLESFRAGWARAVGKIRTMAASSGKPEPDMEEAVVESRRRRLSPGAVRYREDGLHPVVVLYWEQDLEGRTISPSPAFTERFLRAVGALSESQPLDSLRDLPRRTDERAPGAGLTYVGGKPVAAERLPTSITGVEVSYGFDDLKQPIIEVNADALQKIIDFPVSA